MDKPRYIVAEISKNWYGGGASDTQEMLSTTFERVINVNLERGYKLYQFQLRCVEHYCLTTDEPMITETVIAVFERIEQGG